jgi:hypothetical protein
MPKTNYSYKKKTLFRRFSKSSRIVLKTLSNYYPSSDIDSLISETIKEVETLLPHVPYIGGKENFSLNDFFDSIMILALFKVLRKRGTSVRDIAQMMYEIREMQSLKQSRLMKFLTSKLIFSSRTKNNYKKKIKIMTQKAYPENWKMEFVEGDGEEFDWGVNFHECAVQKLFNKHGGEELLPYICMTDYAPFNVLKNVEFKRTQTIASGAPFCDFRFKKGGSTPRGWPPEERDDFSFQEN